MRQSQTTERNMFRQTVINLPKYIELKHLPAYNTSRQISLNLPGCMLRYAGRRNKAFEIEHIIVELSRGG